MAQAESCEWLFDTSKMDGPLNWRAVLGALALLVLLVSGSRAADVFFEEDLPSYHYGAPIPVECMNRSS